MNVCSARPYLFQVACPSLVCLCVRFFSIPVAHSELPCDSPTCQSPAYVEEFCVIISQHWSYTCSEPFPEVEIVVFYESHSFTLSFLCYDFVETPPFLFESSPTVRETLIPWVFCYSATSLIWDILHACIERVMQESTLSLHPYHLHCRSRVFYPWEWKNTHDIREIMLCELRP